MILTDYYKMVHLSSSKSKTRFDCVASSMSYPEFELMATRARTKVFYCYYSQTPPNIKAQQKRRTTMCIMGVNYISGVFTPDIEEHLLFGYGDVGNTTDALLFIFNKEQTEFEIFVARGYKNNIDQLWQLLIDGELDEELNVLRQSAKDTCLK